MSEQTNIQIVQQQKNSVQFRDIGFDEFVFRENFKCSFLVSPYIDDAHSHSLRYMARILEARIIEGKFTLTKRFNRTSRVWLATRVFSNPMLTTEKLRCPGLMILMQHHCLQTEFDWEDDLVMS